LLVREEPNLVILDLRLGQEDGLDLLREIRSRSDVLVIITTGHRRDEIDRVVGLELGADDYITKPFGLRELLARIRAVLRRREAGQAAVRRDQEKGRCRFGSSTVNVAENWPWITIGSPPDNVRAVSFGEPRLSVPVPGMMYGPAV
jgi:DNA-binding response OmpR family regulator